MNKNSELNTIKSSVIMSVYNTKEEYLREAIDSILNQTDSDFEFIIVDDASDEATKAVLHSYTDNRIKLITNNENKGLTVNLNVALQEAKGKYIVRMDADDIAHPSRIEKMTHHMDNNPEINVLGCYMDCGGIIRKYYGNIPHDLRKTLLLFDNTGLGHPSVIFRKSFLDEYNIHYDDDIKKSQDYEIWTRCIKHSNINVYPECLMTYRIHDGQISTGQSEDQNRFMKMVKMRQLQCFKPFISDEQITRFTESDITTSLNLSEYRAIMKAIKKANQKYNIVPKDMLWFALRRRYGVYLNYHYLNLYRIEKYLVVPYNNIIKKYKNIISKEDNNYKYAP